MNLANSLKCVSCWGGKISCILYFLTMETDRHHSVDLTYIIDHHPRQTHGLFVRLVVRGVWQSVKTVESCKGAGWYKTHARGGGQKAESHRETPSTVTLVLEDCAEERSISLLVGTQ